MTRSELIEKIVAQRRAGDCFIKSWRGGYSFVDYELIDRFVDKLDDNNAVEGFALLDIEQIWQTLIELDPDNLVRVDNGIGGEVIEWLWQDSSGRQKKNVYPFTPEGIMTIIDDEFFV